MNAIPPPDLVDLDEHAAGRWQIVNDGVMGGLSRSRITFDASGATFEGDVSLANGGGFAAARTGLDGADLSGWDGVELQAEGGGKTFQLRLRTDDEWDGVAYRALFRAPDGKGDVVRIPWASFLPTWRGRARPDAPPLDPAHIVQLGFLISEEQAGPFRLRVTWIRAYRDDGAGVR